MRNHQAVISVVTIIMLAVVSIAGICQAQDPKTFSISGMVLKPDKTPVAGAHVEARDYDWNTDWRVRATTTSGADGKFTMQLPQGRYRFCAVSDNLVYLNDAEMIEVSGEGSLSKPIEMRLEKGCKIEGSVIDITTGQPVGGVKIITRNGDVTESSDTGAWSMVLRQRGYTITAVKEGYYWPIVNFSASGETAKVKVEIKPGGVIKGKIIDDQGQPVPGARVGTEKSGSFRLHVTRTDDEGRFVLEGHDPDSRVEVSASADGYEYLREHPVTFPAGQREAQIELILKKTKVRTISGQVTKPDGKPIEGAKVAYGSGPSWVDYTIAHTDKDGKYTIDNASYRESIVVASGSGFAPSWKPVKANEDAQVNFQLKPGHTVEGCVEDEDGNPLKEVHLSVSMEVKGVSDMRDDLYNIADVSSDKDGKFKLDSLPEGFVYAQVYAEGYDRLESERLKVDRKDYTLVMRKRIPGHICGTVVKDSDGKPVPEFNVRLDFSRRSGHASGLSPELCEQGVSFQSRDGKFSIKGLEVKDGFRVIVTAPGYRQATADPVIVKPVSEQAYKDLEIRLRPAGPFEGAITEAGSGSPLEGVMVTVWNIGVSQNTVVTHTDVDGKFRFDSMPFSSGAVILEKPGYGWTAKRMAGFTRPLQLSMEKGATITGSIADGQGKVPPGPRINIRHTGMDMDFDKPQINPDGSFKQTDLPPGEYMVVLHIEGQSHSVKHHSFDLQAGETYQVDWEKQGDVVVEGKVLQKGKPVPGARINVNTQKGGRNWAGVAETGADGSYKLALLKPGNYFFSCLAGEWTDPNHICSTKTLELTSGANQVDFNLPCGSISGKLVDKLTGKPLTGANVSLYVRKTYGQHMGRESIFWAEAEPTWWAKEKCKTDKNGVFTASNLTAGEWMICWQRAERSGAIPTATVRLADGEVKSGVVAKVASTGSAIVSFAGMKGLPENTMIYCVDEHGFIYRPKYNGEAWTLEFEDLPVGKMTAVVVSNAYLPTRVLFQVNRNQTTNVTVKLTKGAKIIFRPMVDSVEVTDPVSVAVLITTPDGKPVLQRAEGPRWVEILGDRGMFAGPLSVTVKPGTYLIKAAVRNERYLWCDESDLDTGWSGQVTVTAGKDTVVDVPWEE